LQASAVVASTAAYNPPTPSASRSAVASALPVYRPTPDYETVMRQKLLSQPQPLASELQQPQSLSAPSPVPPPPQQQQLLLQQQPYLRPPPSPLPVGAARQRVVAAVSAGHAAAVAPSPVSKYINGR